MALAPDMAEVSSGAKEHLRAGAEREQSLKSLSEFCGICTRLGFSTPSLRLRLWRLLDEIFSIRKQIVTLPVLSFGGMMSDLTEKAGSILETLVLQSEVSLTKFFSWVCVKPCTVLW